MNDLRFAFRQLLKNPGFTAVAVLTLALGIGLVSTQFTLIDGVLLRPLPFRDAERLFHVARLNDDGNGDSWRPITTREFLEHREAQTTFDDLAAFTEGTFNLSHAGGPPSRVEGCAVSAGFLPMLRMAPQVGRVFQTGEDQPGQPLRIVLGDGLWHDEFGADPAVVGRSVRLNGETATVIGVMPTGFRFPDRESCWVNLRLQTEPQPGRESQRVAAMGLLKPGVSIAAAKADLNVIARRCQQEFEPGEDKPTVMGVRTFPRAYNNGGTVTLLYTMLAMTGLVLALACVNVAGLLFARAAGRVRELAVRSALGAGRGRIVRQLLMESVLLAGLGALLGVALAGMGARLLEYQVTHRMEVASWMHFDLNIRVLAVTVIIAGAAGIVAGILPALRASRINLSEALKDDARGNTGLSSGPMGQWLVTVQTGFAGGLVVVALLLALSALRSGRVHQAIQPDSLLLGRLELRGPAYEKPLDRVRFYNRLIGEVGSTPGVAAVAVSSRDLVEPAVFSRFEVEGIAYARPGDRPGGWLEVVSRDYFHMVNQGALSGRLFGSGDTSDSQPVALVNRSFAARFWPGGDPIGRRIRRDEPDAPWATVVGIVPDLNMEGVGNTEPSAGWYLLQDQQAWGWLDLLVRVQGDPRAAVAPVRAAVASLDPDQPIHTITTLRDRTARRIAGLEIVGTMAGVFAVTAVVLAGVGIYGVTAFTVRRRIREFGVRVALGSTRRGILVLMLRQNLARMLAGVAGGLVLGYGLAMPLSTLLPKVSAADPAIYGVVAMVLGAVTGIAILLPSLWAATVDPTVALRSE